MAARKWTAKQAFSGYVTTYESVAFQSRLGLEQRLGFASGSLTPGYAVYELKAPIGVTDFVWRDRTRYSAGWRGDRSIKFGDDPNIVWSVQRRDELRAALGKRFGYDERTVDAEIDKIMKEQAKKLNVRSGPKRIVKVVAASSPRGFPDSPSPDIPQWELTKAKMFELIEVGFDAETEARLSGAAWWHANEGRYATSAKSVDLAPGFREKVETFIGALTKAGAVVSIAATRRPEVRAYLMHYCSRLSRGDIAARAIPEMKGCDIVWDHGVEAKSRAAAAEMAKLFGIVFPPSLTSLHIAGKAIDMAITWTGTIKVEDAKGKLVEVGAPRSGAKNLTLHKIGKGYGVHKLLSDKPHWSINGH